MADDAQHRRQVFLEGSIGILGEPLRGQPLGCDSLCKDAVDLGFDFEDEVGQGGQAGDSVFEREAGAHRKNAEFDLPQVDFWADDRHHGRDSTKGFIFLPV